MDSIYKKAARVAKAKRAAGQSQTNAMAAARARAMAKPKPFKATGDSALKAMKKLAPGGKPKTSRGKPKKIVSKSIFDS